MQVDCVLGDAMEHIQLSELNRDIWKYSICSMFVYLLSHSIDGIVKGFAQCVGSQLDYGVTLYFVGPL